MKNETWTKYTFVCDPEQCDTLIEVIGSGNKIYKEARHEVKHAVPTWEKSINILEYEYKTDLKHGLTEMWNWAKNQPKRNRYEWPSYELDKGIYSRELVFSQLAKVLGINMLKFSSKDWILNAADQQILEIADQLKVTDAEEFKVLLKGDVAHCENWSNEFIVDWIMVRGFVVKLDLKKVVTRAGNLEHNLSKYLDSFFGVPVSTVEIQELMKGLGILESKQFPSGKIEIHDAAWNQDYRENNARKRLLLHLCAQEERLKSISCHWPCVAVIQSSGYGKSRLVKEMLKKENWRMNDPVKRNVIYWNFGNPEHNGYPRGNRYGLLPSSFKSRREVTDEFRSQIVEEIKKVNEKFGIWFILD
jgi:hypothetical protein